MNLRDPQTGEAVELVGPHSDPRPANALSRIYDRVNAIGGVPAYPHEAARNQVVADVLAIIDAERFVASRLEVDLEIANELLADLLMLDAEWAAIGGGPGFHARWKAAIARANDFMGEGQ